MSLIFPWFQSALNKQAGRKIIFLQGLSPSATMMGSHHALHNAMGWMSCYPNSADLQSDGAPVASVAFNCAVLESAVDSDPAVWKPLMSTASTAGKLLLPWGKLCVMRNHKARLVMHPWCHCHSSMPWDKQSQQRTKVSIAEARNCMQLIPKMKSVCCRELLTINSKINATCEVPNSYLQ